jgi:meso-butanediol dehydrogenase/(S,S)-butanediol dehydrogenase/diacetyl reductase
VNLNGTYYVCKRALPKMPDGRGRIVNIGSVLSTRGAGDQSAYTAAKHAVLGFTRALALHASARGITVNAVCPGWVKTGMAEARWRELGKSEDDAARRIPLGRVALPENVASLVAYLASEEASHVTGQAFVIDGGASV